MRATFSIFPKFYQHLSAEQLAAMVRSVGLDTTNLVVRDGYWVTPAGLEREAPAFVKAMAAAGLKVRFATTGYAPRELSADAEPLRVLADCGIAEFRMGYFEAKPEVRSARSEAREQLEDLAEVCERHKVRGVLQLHQNTLVPSASAAYALVRGLPSEWIGVEIDPGNQAFEGFESWNQAVRLLDDYCVAVGVKDVEVYRDAKAAAEPAKGWKRRWTTIDEGVTNWHDVIGALHGAGFEGTFVFMPFYDAKDPERMTAKLAREVAYLRRVMAEVAGGA